MNEERATTQNGVPAWLILVVAIVALALATAAITATVLARATTVGSPTVGGYGGMMGGYGGMMGGYGPYGSTASQPGPGEPGFVAGTKASPRAIRVFAGPAAAFTPSSITVQRGETVTFVVTTMGPTVHEFQVGPAADVSADKDGTPEIAGIAMMQSKTLTFTFDGSGPYAFACHEAGHYEAGMRGSIVVVG